MARMKLHKSTRFGDNEVYPIYEIDFSGLSSTGYVQEESNDAVGSQAYKYRQWKTINNNIGLYIPRNIPKIETQEGNIIPFWHRYNNLIDDSYHGVVQERYTMPTENLESYAAVQLGVKPDDWGTNPNYIELLRETWIGHDVIRPYTNRTISTWSSTTSYYEDTKRTELRMFFTDAGCSFTCTKMSYSRGDGSYMWPRTYSVGLYPHPTTSIRFPANYAYTDPEGHVIDDGYYINDTVSVISPSTGYADWSNYTDGYNCQMVFVHYVQNGTDFYGVAIIQMNNFTEQSEPVAIHVSAWDKTFWGTSIVAGGGGSGPWTNDGPTSYVQGGQGSFEAPSNNHGDADGTSTGAIADSWSAKGMAYSEGYNKYLIPLRETSPGVFKAPAFKEMVNNLTDPGVLQGFRNLMYNPISAVITCALIPRSFAPATAGVDYIHAAGLDLTSENAAAMYEQTYKRVHIGSVNVNSFTDSFADFDNTAVYIHLPYVGNFQLDTAAVMEGELSVDYLIDYFTNDITAIVWTRDKFGNYNYRYEWKGNCGKPMPLTQINTMSSKMAAAMLPVATGLGVGAIAGAVSGLAMGGKAAAITAKTAPILKGYGMSTGNIVKNVGGAALHNFGAGFQEGFGSTMGGFVGQQSLVGTAVSAAQALTSGQSILSSNANGGSVSSPINTQCYLAIVRPMWSAPEDYGKLFGYPSDISGTINQSDTELGDPFTNFLSVRAILLDGMTCLPEEKVEIENLMKAGVYVSND